MGNLNCLPNTVIIEEVTFLYCSVKFRTKQVSFYFTVGNHLSGHGYLCHTLMENGTKFPALYEII